jgi:hypothetical protein
MSRSLFRTLSFRLANTDSEPVNDRTSDSSGAMSSATYRSATDPGRAEWYMNNLRVLRVVPKAWIPLMPQGTTSNESLHAEINGWFMVSHSVPIACRPHKTTRLVRWRPIQLS